ncbi:MAG: hypothetical protein HRT34_01035 [Alcanivorax sp.]|nr:hypothetical protein [Alcanivorax sp.]
MKWLLPLAQVLGLLIEAWQQWRDKQRDEKRQEQHEQIDSDTDAVLRDRGWLHGSGREGADVPDQPDPDDRAD